MAWRVLATVSRGSAGAMVFPPPVISEEDMVALDEHRHAHRHGAAVYLVSGCKVSV